MTLVVTLYLALVLLMCSLVWITVWSRRNTNVRHWVIVSLIPVIVFVVVVLITSLGHHKPSKFIWTVPETAELLAYKFIEDRAIYLYLNIYNVDEPLPVVLPWNTKHAQKIQDLYEKARKKGRRGARVNIKKYDKSLEQFFVIHEPPQEKALPIKKEDPYHLYEPNN